MTMEFTLSGRYGALGRTSPQDSVVAEAPIRPYEVYAPVLAPAAAAS